jgi:hypothetical protein
MKKIKCVKKKRKIPTEEKLVLMAEFAEYYDIDIAEFELLLTTWKDLEKAINRPLI